MSEKEKRQLGGTAEAGMVAIGRAASRPLTEAEVQAGILRSMREVVARPYNPQALRAPDNVKVTNAPQVVTAGEPRRGSGWQAERPLTVHSAKGSREEALIDGMAEKFVGGPNSEKKENK